MLVRGEVVGGRVVGGIPVVGGALGDRGVLRARLVRDIRVAGRRPAGLRRRVAGLRLVVGGRVLVGGRLGDGGEAVEGVAALEQVVEDGGAQVVEVAFRAGAAQAQGGGVDVGLGGQRVGDVELAARDAGVPRPLELDLDAPARRALSLRFRAASGSSLITRAAARRASVSARTSGAAAARISSALAASSGLRQPVYAAMIAARSASIRPSDMPCSDLGRRVVRLSADSISRPASTRLTSSSDASSTPGNSPARQPARTPRALAASSSAARRRPNSAIARVCR